MQTLVAVQRLPAPTWPDTSGSGGRSLAWFDLMCVRRWEAHISEELIGSWITFLQHLSIILQVSSLCPLLSSPASLSHSPQPPPALITSNTAFDIEASLIISWFCDGSAWLSVSIRDNCPDVAPRHLCREAVGLTDGSALLTIYSESGWWNVTILCVNPGILHPEALCT